ncbi:MAG: glycosyltransferase family 4 protein [Mycobacteriales bacterium]
MTRFAVVGPAYPYKGGAARHVTELAHQLVAAGHEVVIESWRAQYPKLLYPGQQTVSEPGSGVFSPTRRELAWYRPDGWWRVGRRLGRSVDVVVLFVYSPVQVPAYLGMLRGIAHRAQVIALCNNVLPHERRPIDVTLMQALLRRSDATFVHSPAQAALAAELTAKPVGHAALAPHLPVPAAPLPVPTQPWRRLLFFGLVRPYKGLDVLLRALASAGALNPSLRGVRLRVAGEFWGGTAATEALIDSLGLAESVELCPGYVADADLPAVFADVDALVLPYRSATASQNAWIAFQFGVPVIATRAGTLADPVTDGVDGIVCDPDDVSSLTQALQRFYAPGQPLRLRRAVAPVDPRPYWEQYVATLVGLAVDTRPALRSPATARGHDEGGSCRG